MDASNSLVRYDAVRMALAELVQQLAARGITMSAGLDGLDGHLHVKPAVLNMTGWSHTTATDPQAVLQ